MPIRMCGLVGIGVLVALTPAATAHYLSPLALAADEAGGLLYVAEATAHQVAVVNLAEGAVTRLIPLSGAPTGLCLAPDGKTLYVTVGGPAGKLCAVDVARGLPVACIPCGHTPCAPVVSADGTRVYVCSRFDDVIRVVDPAAKKVVAEYAAVREPFAAVLTPDGAVLAVANHLPAGASDGAYVAAQVTLVDTASGETAHIELPNGSTGLRGMCASPDGAFAYVTHILGRYHLPTTQLERGWMNTNAVTIVDLAGKKLVNTVLLDSVDLGAANPWGVACTADGAQLCVAQAGTHEFSVIDRAGLHAKLDRLAGGEAVSPVSQTPEDVPNDLSFLVDLRRRLPLPGKGPRGVAIVGAKAYAAQYFSDSLGVIDLADEHAKAVCLPLGPPQALTQVRQGELFFNDATLCFQKWQSCASCHPDVRADGLNWDLLNDGMGNPKNTKSLLLAHATPPAMVSGVRGDAETAVRAGIRHIQFAVRPDEDAQAIDAFLKQLAPVASPVLTDPELRAAAERGKAVFEEAGCAGCHSGPLHTNMQSFDVGTGKGLDADKAFDTPTLVEAWRTAPYLYDGRAATIKEVITTFNPDDKHGTTSGLTPEQIEDLAAYVCSL